MSHIFVSYSSRDRRFVEQLSSDLKSSGSNVWLDIWKLPTGNPIFWQNIQNAIDTCSHFLFVISNYSLDPYSGALKELYYATGLRPAPIIIPIIEPSNPISYNNLPIVIPSNMYQIYDFHKSPYQDCLDKLLSALSMATTTDHNPNPIVQVFSSDDFNDLAHFLVISDKLNTIQSRRSFCDQLNFGLSDELDFIHEISNNAFAERLIAYLYRKGNFPALLKAVSLIEALFHGNLANNLRVIKEKLENSN